MRYLLATLLIVSILFTVGCAKRGGNALPEARLSIQSSGYFWLNVMPPVPSDGPSFHAVFKMKVAHVGGGIVRNVKAVSATIILMTEDGETEFGVMELQPAPNTSVENALVEGEQIEMEFGGGIPGATRIVPGVKAYAKVFIVWDGGHTTVETLAGEVIATH